MNTKNKPITYTLAVPLLSNSFKIKFIQKTEWTIIDYLLLKELLSHDMTLEHMSVKTNLPKQLTLQIILPMCEIGWVSIVAQDNQFVFRLTEKGKQTSISSNARHELPGTMSSYTKNREIQVDDFDNYYDFYKIGVTPINQNRLMALKEESEGQLIVMESRQSAIFPDYEKIKKAVKTANTEVNGIDDLHNFKIDTRKYILLDMIYHAHNKSKIINDKIKNFLCTNLVEVIENTLPNNTSSTKSKDNLINISTFQKSSFSRELHKDNVEFTYGDNPTKELLFDFIENATDYLIIHSTFIGKWAIKADGKYTETFVRLKAALQREVKIYILWGKTNEDEDEDNIEDEAVKQQLTEFNMTCKEEGIINTIDFNKFGRTDSHAKFLITNYADKGHRVVLSSCNFLYANFKRFEASIAIHDDTFAKKMLEISANLACGTNPYNTDVRTNIRAIANNIIDRKIKPIDTILQTDLLTVTLVLKGEHYEYIDRASNNAKKRIYITSDLINEIPQRPIYDRLAKCKTPQKCLFYTRPSKYIETDSINRKAKELMRFNPPIKLRRYSYNNHSKVLAWDTDDILITSLNWLSSDSTSKGEDYHEIGIHVKGTGVSKTFIEYFQTKN